MNNNDDKLPSTPTGRRADTSSSRHHPNNNSSDSNSSPGGRSSLSSSPGSYVFRRGWLGSKNKKDSLKKESLKLPKVTTKQAPQQPQQQPKLSMRQAKKDSADISFLRSLSGSGDVSLDNARVDGTMSSSNTAVTPTSGTVRTTAPAAAVNSLTPTRGNTSTTPTPAGYSDADNAFLRAMRGEPEQATTSKAFPEKSDSFNVKATLSADASSDADNAFLRAFRGESQENRSNVPKQHSPTIAQAAEPKSAYRDETVGTRQPSVPATDDMAHANAAFLGALHASTDPPDDAMPFKGGTFVLDSKHQANLLQKQSSGNQSDADSAFLLAMRGSSQSLMRPTSFGGSDDFGGSGTLVLNMVPKQKQSQESSFFKSIDSEDAHMQHNRGDTKEDAHAVSETEEEEDDDLEGLVVPSHPYIEKVMLPRPLFFGYRLPPRIIEEAELAAKIYANESDLFGSKRGWFDKEDEAVRESKESSSESARKEGGDESGSIHSKSTLSTFSTTMGGGKLFESSLLPCARNFEGALETFGFGQNPFTANWDNGGWTEEETDLDELPKSPHPYLSMYSPVWGDRARADRARTKRKKAKLAEAEMKRDASNQSSNSLNRLGSADGNRIRSQSLPDPEKVLAFSSNRVEANNQFLSNLRSSSPVNSQSTTEEANNLFLSNLRSCSPVDMPSKTEGTKKQFLSNSRSSSPVDFQSSTEEANNQFLRNLRSISPVDHPSELEKGNNQFLSNLRSTSPVITPLETDVANSQVLSNLRSRSTVDRPATIEEANNQFLSNLRSSPPTLPTATEEANDQFLSNLRSSSSVDLLAKAPDSNDFSQDQFLMLARGDAGGSFLGKPVVPAADTNTGGGTFVVNKPKPVFKMDSSTFVAAVKSGDVGSDDDSIKNEEDKQEVGLNDNMAAAAAMLAGEDADDDADDNIHGITTSVINLAAGGGAKSANKFGRPYSNLELTGGCVPRFGCDDPSLPHESDLGVFETKDEEKRSNERRREKNIIEDMTVPGIMPTVVCPTQCTDVDDSQSWNSRQAASDGRNKRKASNTVIISLADNKSPTSSGSLPPGKSTTYEATRLGWWNIPDGIDENATGTGTDASKKRRNGASSFVEVSPAFDDPVPLDVITNLWPSPQALRNNNISAARLHAATSSARHMPHLSDRNPNLRHLQIDTTAVGFPKLGGEVEPMFCKLAIYHFEMSTAGPSSDHDIDESVASTISSSGVSVSSQPTRDSCGPVTEALNFDVVQDPEVIEKCKRAIWPYANEKELDHLPGAIGDSSKINDNIILEGSPCGVFPLPSHMHISNLYAVLLVHKVVSDLGDQQPYLKPNRRDKSATGQKEDIDLAKLRENASKAAESYGQLITPIAFGVLPLMQIVGNEESPKVPVTRVVQIPLFKFEQGKGTDIISDHITGMLHPRANPKVGKVASMTRGHAFLVMRYFGFLGLHSIVSKIKMARNRLVDFTRELQVKRRGDASRKESEKCHVIGDPYVVSPWRQQYVVEPAPFGGRSVPTQPKRLSAHVTSTSEPSKAADDVESTYIIGYAQELASLPLENSGIEVKSSRRHSTSRKSSASHKFDCMLLHTSFCNELICHPRILLNCPKKNVVIKIELRELQWNDALKVEVAIPIKPSIHNARRGPWLVQEAFTSCALKAANPQFLDEFKIKLPLILGESERIVLFFSVYHVNIQTRKGSLLQSTSRRAVQRGTDLDAALEHLGSGILPLTSDESPSCLLSNGDHKVPIQYQVLDLDNPADRAKLLSPSSRQHQSKLSTSSLGNVIGHLRSVSWSNEDVMRTASADTVDADEEVSLCVNQELILESLSYPKGTLFLEQTDLVIPESEDNDQNSIQSESKVNQLSQVLEGTAGSLSQGMRPSLSSGNLQQLGSTFKFSEEVRPLVLKVNIIAFSSVHPQNRFLSDFFILKPNRPRCLTADDFSGLSPWGKQRSEILYRLKPERIPPFNFVGGALAETERKLLDPVVSLSKTSKCPAFDMIPHLLRVISQLWRTMVSGIGEPSILWADPGSLIPLRLNAFATLLHVVSSASHHMAKAGLKLLDGDTKWNVSALSKTLSLLFDELKLFGGPLEELVQKEEEEKTTQKISPPNEIKGSPSSKLLSKKPSKLTRSKTSNEQGTPKPKIIQRFSSEETKIPTSFDVDAMLRSAQSTQKKEETGSNVFTSRDMGLKVDTRNDFMSAMREAAASEDAFETETAGNHLMNSFGSMSNNLGPSNRRRFFTLPAMATIQESESEDNRIVAQESSLASQSSQRSELKGSPLDTELIVHQDRAKPKQFRVPGLERMSTSSLTKSETEETVSTARNESKEKKHTVLAINDDDIESAGTAFLDKISQTMGIVNNGKEMGGENRRLGAAHHRKTRSRCSIDWTLPPTDILLEKDQEIEQRKRTEAGATTAQLAGFSTNSNFADDASTDDDTYESVDDGSVIEKQESEANTATHPLKRKTKDRNKTKPLVLPDFADRMSAMKDAEKPHRWWPYAYEVIIYQWLTLLIEQTKKGDSVNKAVEDSQVSKSTLSPIVVKYLSHAAKAARGATIRCAPYLLEIIKQSLSWRIDVMFRDRKKAKPRSNEGGLNEMCVPQLVKLDENILTAIEKLVTMLTDASIDSRNFDSFEFRKISIDVNDAVVRFLRDLFSMLDVQSVHRLVMVYFSRFVIKEGKHWHDRDSKTTGLRCSWETTKLRLNAVTLLVRFPDFMKVNMSLIERSWKSSSGSSSAGSTRRFYAGVLERMARLGLGEITSSDGPIRKSPVCLPKLRPHWLAELCTDILLSATGHAEEGIQHRASSLLFELFWTSSTEGRARGNVSIVASVFVPFVTKVLAHIEYMSSLPGKCQLRKDIVPCVLFVLQSAPIGLMRALWRKLAKRVEGKAQSDNAIKYGGLFGVEGHANQVEADSTLTNNTHGENMHGEEPDLYDMFGLLNLALSTIEYDGCEMNDSEENPVWRQEFLLSADRGRGMITAMDRRLCRKTGQGNDSVSDDSTEQDNTHNSRRWHAHDCAMVVINSCRQIVRETLGMLKPSINPESDDFNGTDPTSIDFHGSLTFDELFLSKTTSSSMDNVDSGKILGQGDEDKTQRRYMRKVKTETLTFTINDTIIFVRATTSVYLHALTMRQSDVVVSKTLTACLEVVKIFGIKVFLNAVGETLQHWIRVTLEHCGARRADVRVEASEFLNLLLRLTWDSYGSFFRIRLPLLSVQTEVMERIVAKASTKYEKEQRSLRLSPVKLSTECAEASLAPLWKTIDRIHFKSASQNLSFKSALARLAIMMKKLYKAYLSVHALTLLAQSEEIDNHNADLVQSESNPYVQRMRVSVHRIVSNAAGYSKQLLGNQATTHLVLSSIQSETIEDSLFTAADVFSSTELPSHRFAFLEKLAEFHRRRSRFAEEGTCRLHIYHTFREAAKQHAHIWSSSPFLPWASNQSDELPSGNEGPTGGAVLGIDYDDNLSANSGKYLEKNTSFRRIFYRAADSVLVRTGDWAGFGGGKFLFYGVTLKSEFNSSTSWFTLREMEQAMVGQAETAGELFLRSGIVESSRSAYNLATHFYSETFNYARLAQAYKRLARVVTSKIPVVDTGNQYDMSSQIGRFYKVYFHGGCPDDILHAQGSEGFIYRVPSSVGIKEFASRLESSVRSILPAKSTIDLLLDDGSPTMPLKTAGGKRQLGIGGAPIEPIKIKVTPIRPLFKMEDTEKCFRGTPEWFQLKSDEYDSMLEEEAQMNSSGGFLHQRQISISTSNTYSSSGSTTISNRRSSFLSNNRNSRPETRFNEFEKDKSTAETIGVDRFYFTQPAKKDPVRGFRDWLKAPTGSFAERSLRVTELQVEDNFPACVTRQKIIHRAIFSQSPLEAGVEAVSTWCSLLFRTIMATNGIRVLSNMTMQEEGLNIICVAKVLADCIHSSGVKQIGLLFLSVNQPDNKNNETSYYSSYERLSEEEIEKTQTKLARIIVIFLELLHLLIARNRDVLLAVVQSRKRRGGDSASVASGSHEGHGAAHRMSTHHSPIKVGYEGQEGDSHYKIGSDVLGKSISTSNNPSGHKVSNSDRTDAAIGVQSELQRGFISLVRALSPNLLDTINTEVPRWMRQCCQENYFSSGLYRQADIPIGEELFFNVDTNEDRGMKDDSSVPISINRGSGQIYRGASPGNSLCGTEISDGKRSEQPASTVSVQSASLRSRRRDTTISGSSQGTGKGGF